MSSDTPPEFFLDRSLGRTSARTLRSAGLTVHLIAECHPSEAQEIGDAEWVARGCRRGWVLLTRDRRIRYRTDALGALTSGHLFCLADGDATLDQVTRRLLAAMPAIRRAIRDTGVGFWHVHANGRISRMWP